MNYEELPTWMVVSPHSIDDIGYYFFLFRAYSSTRFMRCAEVRYFLSMLIMIRVYIVHSFSALTHFSMICIVLAICLRCD